MLTRFGFCFLPIAFYLLTKSNYFAIIYCACFSYRLTFCVTFYFQKLFPMHLFPHHSVLNYFFRCYNLSIAIYDYHFIPSSPFSMCRIGFTQQNSQNRKKQNRSIHGWVNFGFDSASESTTNFHKFISYISYLLSLEYNFVFSAYVNSMNTKQLSLLEYGSYFK